MAVGHFSNIFEVLCGRFLSTYSCTGAPLADTNMNIHAMFLTSTKVYVWHQNVLAQSSGYWLFQGHVEVLRGTVGLSAQVAKVSYYLLKGLVLVGQQCY